MQQLHQQLLTTLYCCPASSIEEELSSIVQLWHSAAGLSDAESAQDARQLATQLSVAVCRAFGIACPASISKLVGLPFLLLLQGAASSITGSGGQYETSLLSAEVEA